MRIFSCNPHAAVINLEGISYEDAMILKTMLENDRVVQSGEPSRWAELIGALQLIIIANQPAEIVSATDSRLRTYGMV